MVESMQSTAPSVSSLYVGRLVAVGQTTAGRNAILYRISSRSFADRRIILTTSSATVFPLEGHESDIYRNPYIFYQAAAVTSQWALFTNGSHTDSIASKLSRGTPPRDALAATLLAYDYEADSYSTPRIAALLPHEGSVAWLAIVAPKLITVQEVSLRPGECVYTATYERDRIALDQTLPLLGSTALQIAYDTISAAAYGHFSHPVAAISAVATPDGFELGTHTIPTTDPSSIHASSGSGQ